MKTPTLPVLEADATNDTAALTCYALEWREVALSESAIKDQLIEALEYWFDSRATPSALAGKARAALAKARGEG